MGAGYLQSPEEGSGFPGNGVADSCEPLLGFKNEPTESLKPLICHYYHSFHKS